MRIERLPWCSNILGHQRYRDASGSKGIQERLAKRTWASLRDVNESSFTMVGVRSRSRTFAAVADVTSHRNADDHHCIGNYTDAIE